MSALQPYLAHGHPAPHSVADLLAQHSEEELIALKLVLRKQVARLEFEIEQFDRALAQKATPAQPSTEDGGQPPREKEPSA